MHRSRTPIGSARRRIATGAQQSRKSSIKAGARAEILCAKGESRAHQGSGHIAVSGRPGESTDFIGDPPGGPASITK